MLHAERVEPLDDPLGARARASRASSASSRSSTDGVAQVQAEEVRLAVAFDGAQLDAGTMRTPSSSPARARFGEPVDRVVIGERDRGEPGALRRAHHVGRRARAVGRRRVHVQVDEARAGPPGPVTRRSRPRATCRSAATARSSRARSASLISTSDCSRERVPMRRVARDAHLAIRHRCRRRRGARTRRGRTG